MITQIVRDLSNIYVIHPDFILRNESKFIIIAHHRISDNGDVFRLSPIEGLILSLFDGTREINEIIKICMAFFPESSKDSASRAECMLQAILRKYKGSDKELKPIVKLSSLSPAEKKRIRKYNPEDYIIKPNTYKPNDMQLAVPASLLWLVTNECTTRCQYCYMPQSHTLPKDMLPWNRMKDIIFEAHDLGVLSIPVSGGDPLCFPLIFDFFEELEKYNFEPIRLSTKCYISSETAIRIAKYQIIKSVQFSIDSTIPEIADYLVQVPGFCQRILESIDNVLKAGIKVTTKTVITPYNLPTIPKLYRDLRSRGVDSIVLATYARSGFRHDDKLFNNLDDYEWLDQAIANLKNDFPRDIIVYLNGKPHLDTTSQQERLDTWKNRNRCTAGRESLTITPSGKIIACEQMPQTQDYYLGDLRTQSIQEVWNSSIVHEHLINPPRANFLGTTCQNCNEFEECQYVFGACIREVHKLFGTRWAPVPNCPNTPSSQRTI